MYQCYPQTGTQFGSRHGSINSRIKKEEKKKEKNISCLNVSLTKRFFVFFLLPVLRLLLSFFSLLLPFSSFYQLWYNLWKWHLLVIFLLLGVCCYVTTGPIFIWFHFDTWIQRQTYERKNQSIGLIQHRKKKKRDDMIWGYQERIKP